MQFLDLAGVKKFKDYVDENFTTVEQHENAEQVTAAALNDLNDRVVNIEDSDWVTTEEFDEIEHVARDTYTKEEVDRMFTEYEPEIIETDPIFTSSAAANITSSDITNWNNKTNNIGTVTQVKVGTTSYNPSSGVVTLPAYPTTLPASDVSAWAKASTKPTYTASEVGAATESYVNSAVSNLVNSAPTTLDTLNELATALGNDPNFATTIATQIGEKYTKPGTGIPKTDLASDVQTSLGKADSAIQGITVNNAAVTVNSNKIVNIRVPILIYPIEIEDYSELEHLTIPTTLYNTIKNDCLSGKLPIIEIWFDYSDGGNDYFMQYWFILCLVDTDSDVIDFMGRNNDGFYLLKIYSDGSCNLSLFYPEKISNKVTSLSSSSTNTQYPSAKLVYDQLALKAPKASPAFTGTPTAPTAATNTNNTQIATTAFVKNAITANAPDLSDYVDFDTYNDDQETISGALTDLNTRVNGKQDSMVMLTYGTSTWNDFITAYNKNAVVYCYVPTDANGRLAFMAWKTPDFVEFQYYRSVSSHSATQQGDQVFIYTLTSASAWSTTTREAIMWTQAGNGLQRSVSGNNLTYSVKVPSDSGLTVNSSGVKVTTPLPSTSASDNGKVLSVVNGAATWVSDIVYIACHLIASGNGVQQSDGRWRRSLIEDSNFPEFNYTEFNTARSNGKIVMCVVETSTTDCYYLPFYYIDNTEILFAIQSGVEVHLDIDNADHVITQADAYLTNFNGTYNSLAGKPTIPTTLDQIADGNIRKLGNVTVDDDSGILSDSSNLLQSIFCADGAIYAIGSDNSNGDEDFVLATTNQLPTAITTADIQAGTATTARTITAAVLAANYNITDGTINIAGDSITIKTARIEVNDLAGWTSETGYSTLYTTIVNSLKASSNNLWRLAITEDQDPYWPITYYYLSYFGEEDGFIEFIGSDNTTIALWNNGNIIKSVASPITPGTLITNATTAQTASSGEAMSGTITLHKIAKTGTYSDLIGTPTIPTIESLTTSEIDTIWNNAT